MTYTGSLELMGCKVLESTKLKFASGKLVMPGEELCVVEEFTPGEGAYEKDGKVYAMRVGLALYDFVSRRVHVITSVEKNTVTPKAGNIVYGQIVALKDDLASVKIMEVENTRKFSGIFSGVLHISQVSKNFIKTIDEAVKLGDIIRAKVVTSWNPYQLTTKHATLGVVLALCSKCGSPLWKVGDKLVCKKCGNTERRKISTRYLLKERK